ncbi:MAG: GspH/FimT family pseudopilin [Rhodoferax sp.]|nr:GspH/FimT family pseudopilin [Rhodoferax sp.]MDP3651533.1 GspH/FimT family pseudopilin [Rhodoferax sp.]
MMSLPGCLPLKARLVRGFTLTELMTTVAILAVLMGLAAPTFSDIALSSRLKDAANRLVSFAAVARSEAIKRNAVVTMCMSADAASCATTGGWEQGWIMRTTTEVLHKDTGAPSGYKVNGNVGSINFDPVGVGTTQATLTVCRHDPEAGSQERVVTVSATGKATSVKTTTGTCA